MDQITTYEAEDGVTARDILVISRNLAPGLSSVLTVSVLSFRSVICVRCVSAAGVPVRNIERSITWMCRRADCQRSSVSRAPSLALLGAVAMRSVMNVDWKARDRLAEMGICETVSVSAG